MTGPLLVEGRTGAKRLLEQQGWWQDVSERRRRPSSRGGCRRRHDEGQHAPSRREEPSAERKLDECEH